MDRQEKEEKILHVSEKSFEQDVLQAAEPVLVDFWAPWCGPCQRVAPMLEELVSKYPGKLSIAKVNVDENAAIAAQYGVRSIPSLMIFKEGKMVDSVIGAIPLEELERFVSRWV